MNRKIITHLELLDIQNVETHVMAFMPMLRLGCPARTMEGRR